ncbi:MAG: Lead, cadmium, zinc and mercury transporting ATPase (EC (EC; Copper-translocating P-type ATPase (EC [uncultured Thiotrichaceae bacterium]|uniref:P-type Zn(2+) transporter n=1 Tax=uncultured Thiotrichaceae bacterium TaxID=298394 RepID=A0A6S6U1C4_9GAMM|nr:MAG: Lead, cadmium, zinc and mercury transporting ATPase (EC (EC; Copper-translocating P-type ATPase (EC [uncultured Thiotrichaceae bacterium]
MLFSLLTISALATATIKVSDSRRRKRAGKQRRLLSTNPTNTSFSLSQMEERYQVYIEQKFDHLMGDGRKQQLQQLNTDTSAEISEEARKDNRYLLTTGINAGAAVTLGIVAPSLLILTVPGSLYFSWRHFRWAWQAFKQERRITISAVDAASAIVAAAAGFWRVWAVSIFLFAVFIKLRNKAKHKSQQKLTSIFSQTTTLVWVLHDGIETETRLEQLQESDVLVVRSGEVIPVDGVIIDGTGLVDERLLTGESQPVEKQVEDNVFASTLLLSGHLQLQMQKAGQQTVAARIGEILEKTSQYKNRHESMAEQFVDRSAVPTLVMSALAFPVSGISGAIGVLWSSFGYNMRISSPMGVINFLRHASEKQILIKDGLALDELPHIDTVIFDKTGTLTEEDPELHKIHVFADYSEADLLRYAAAAEQRQSHPIAHSIIAAANKQKLTIPTLEENHCKLGYGIEAIMCGLTIQLGSSRFIEESHIVVSKPIRQIRDTAEANGHSLVMLAINGELSGAIELQPRLRPSAPSVINFLKQQGIKTCIISGDREIPTRALSEVLGIDQYFANTLPENKASIIKELQDKGQKICFIGDGLNDAIALKQADVSVSLNGATTVATDTAQIILMDANLGHLATLVAMGKAFQESQKKNLRLSVIPATLSIAGIFALHAGLVLAAAMFYLSMGLSIRNSTKAIQLPQLPSQDKDSK